MGHRAIIGVMVKLERLHIVTESPPAFFKMDFKNRALSRGIVVRPFEVNNRVENILALGRATLRTAFARLWHADVY